MTPHVIISRPLCAATPAAAVAAVEAAQFYKQ